MNIIYGDICEFKADAIVNASNGMGFMGCFIAKHIKCKGIAEAINYKTKGVIEAEARKKCKLKSYLPIILSCRDVGDVFYTSAGNLNAKYIFHAVTMKYPGTKSDINIIKDLVFKIIEKAYILECKSIATPLLGTGVGGLNQDEVLEIYKDVFKDIKDIEINIILLEK